MALSGGRGLGEDLLNIAVAELQRVVGGELVGGDAGRRLGEISIDSRTIEPGQFFVPLVGEAHDAHNFLDQAISGGASGAVIGDWEVAKHVLASAIGSGLPVIRVEDTLEALWKLASFMRGQIEIPVVGITGSTGKTTTKDLLSSILNRRMKAVFPLKSHNNEVGVPLTVTRVNEETEVLVLELAMRRLGEIEALVELTKPTFGLVTNVGQSHLELLGSEQSVADAKGELVAAVPEEGYVVLNADDVWTKSLTELSRARTVTFGLAADADYVGEIDDVDSRGCPAFTIHTESSDICVKLPFPGRHQVHNALAAAAVADCLGVPWPRIKEGLEAASLSGMRMDLLDGGPGITILNDAYNASPVSVEAALETLSDIETPGRRIAVLGDMLELGDMSEDAHARAGELAAELKMDKLVAVGQHAAIMASGARRSGMAAADVSVCHTVGEAREILEDLVVPGDTLLLKASRKVGLEELADMVTGPGRG